MSATMPWPGITPDAVEGDFYVRSGPRSIKLAPASARAFIDTRFRQ